MAMAAAGASGQGHGRVAESAESLQINGESTLKRHNWPTDQFYGPGELANTTTWDNNAALGFSYALDLWGRESNATERAVDLAHMSVAEARQAQLELQNNIVRAYIELSLHYASATSSPPPSSSNSRSSIWRKAPERRHRHPFRSQPGRNAAAGNPSSARCAGRRNRPEPQPDGRAGR
jgi:hypothetical protein